MSEHTSDLLSGYADIGAYLRMNERQAKHLAAVGALPTFKLPGSNIVRARKSRLDAYLAEQEAAARKAPPAEPSAPEAEGRRRGR